MGKICRFGCVYCHIVRKAITNGLPLAITFKAPGALIAAVKEGKKRPCKCPQMTQGLLQAHLPHILIQQQPLSLSLSLYTLAAFPPLVPFREWPSMDC